MRDSERMVPLPPVLRSRRELERSGISFLLAGSAPPSSIPLVHDGATYSMAQEARWLDRDHFAVGRWDGTLSIFAFVDSPTRGPLITTAASDPASEGVQMICVLEPGLFAASGGSNRLTIWRAAPGWRDLYPQAVEYPPKLGAANSAALLRPQRRPVLVVGHASGFLSMWSVETSRVLTLLKTVDVRSSQPTNPWGLHNVRGVSAIDDDRVVCASEDGCLSVVTVPGGELLTQTVYNPDAARGINAIALSPTGDLLVANCSVGASDFNLWYFALDAAASHPKPQLRDRANLRVNPQAPQVFNFSTVWTCVQDQPQFCCSTQEGALWMGCVESNRLRLYGYEPFNSPLGSALSFAADGRLVLVSHDIYELRVHPPVAPRGTSTTDLLDPELRRFG